MAGHDVDRLALLARVTAELDRLERPDERESALEEWRSRSTLTGKGVEVRLPDRTFGGTATAIDDEGALLVHTASGVERVVTGDVRLS
jgi:BirA family biotin operon repressor/biotin-[acetyl-CoA-carboxylase] ligase